MANQPIKVRINCEKIIKGEMYPGKNGAILDLVIWPNRDGEDQFGNTHYCVQDISKESKAKGAKGMIIGNAKVPQQDAAPMPQRPPARQSSPGNGPVAALDEDGDTIPF